MCQRTYPGQKSTPRFLSVVTGSQGNAIQSKYLLRHHSYHIFGAEYDDLSFTLIKKQHCCIIGSLFNDESVQKLRCWYSLEKWYLLEKKNFDFFASGFGYWSPFTSADVKALSEWGHLPLRRIPQWIFAHSSLAESLFESTTPDPASIREALVAKLIHKQKQTKSNQQKRLRPFPLGSLGTQHITEWPGHNMNRMCTSQWHHIKQHHLLLELSTNPCVNSFVKFDLFCVESLHKTGAEL